MIKFCQTCGKSFQSTPPARGATFYPLLACSHKFISIHAPREGGDSSSVIGLSSIKISIHAPREGGDDVLQCVGGLAHLISIHAPREGGRRRCSPLRPRSYHFNPRPPRGGRPTPPRTANPCYEFQSTPPARGATAPYDGFDLDPGISIHAPREGGDNVSFASTAYTPISIHAPREGGDGTGYKFYWDNITFQSTPPARGATCRR